VHRVRALIDRDGHIAVPLPAPAAARARELLAAVPALVGDDGHVTAMTALAERWARSPSDRAAIVWGRRRPDDPRGGKAHLQTVAAFDHFVAAQPGVPDLLRAVVRRLSSFGAAAERLLGGLGVPVRCTVRANAYDAGGGVPVHVDESAFTVVFTETPRQLLVAGRGRRAPLRPVRADGWHAVVLPGEQAGLVVPGVLPSPHAAAPTPTRRLSVTVFACVDHATLPGSTSRRPQAPRTVAA
jgi:hypothetical protein